ncbi:septum formation initiator family protein [Candidatus Uhrbacteria bacterium]|nr:septum formation initiator family protein [Candidatus Uhrbacteria bacterium]
MIRRSPSRSWLTSKVALLVGCAVVVLVVVAIVRETQRRRSIRQEIRAIEDEIARIELQRERLTDLVEHAASPEFLEREARLRLGLQRPGETVLIVPDSAPGSAVAAEASPSPAEEPPSNLRKWWRYIFH